MRISDWSSDVCSSDLTQILGQMLGSISRPSALFCSNDLLATAVIVGLRQLGYSVPEDISVAGFDGIRYGTVMSPSLTTIEAAGYEIGKTACHLLLEQIEQQPPRSQQVDRQSTRPNYSN